MAANASDIKWAATCTRMMNKMAGDVVFRRLLGTYSQGMTTSFRSTSISASALDNSINWPAGSFVTQGIVAGAWIQLMGWTGNSGQNNGWAKVLTVSALKVTLEKAMATEAAGETIGVALSTDYEVKGYMSQWEQRYWNGTTIKPTDGMVLVDLNSMPEPEPERTLFYAGPDPATAKEFTVRALVKIWSGNEAPLGMVGVRA